MPPAKFTSTKRFAVRLSLVTGSTLATIIGAQSLASLDKQAGAVPDPTTPMVSDPQLQSSFSTIGGQLPKSSDVTNTENNSSVIHAAPTITILRRPGQVGASAASSTTSIKPPTPIQIAPPEPIIVQAPSAPPVVVQAAGAAPAPASRPSSRSSR
jgi:hypothetical protein